jgi:hypothetical protein
VIENFGTTHEFGVSHGFYLSNDAVIDADDEFLGALAWDVAFQDAFQFDVDVSMPDDWPAGSYHLGSILDDLDEIPEQFEDNNAVRYCAPLTVERLAPVILPRSQERTVCGRPYTGSRPSVTHPRNMAPLTWSLVNPEPGMRIDPATGVVSWPRPVVSTFLYTLLVQAANSGGADTEVLFLGVEGLAPQLTPIPDQTIGCGESYTGPRPRLTSADCMNPILIWTLVSGPPGMTADPDTGIVDWQTPFPADDPHRVTLRAANVLGAAEVSWNVTVRTGDWSGDGAVTKADFADFSGCLEGPGRPPASNCACGDGDGDGDVDLADAALFLVACRPE